MWWYVFLAVCGFFVAQLIWFYASVLPVKSKFPPGPFPLPFLGNLPQLLPDMLLGLRKMHSKYGPVLGLHFAGQPTVIVACPKIAKELFVKRGKIYSSRPHTVIASRILEYDGKDLVLCPFGEDFLKKRKLFQQVLNVRTIRSLNVFIDWESKDVCQVFFQRKGQPIVPRYWMQRLSLNVIYRTTFGKTYGHDVSNPEFIKMMRITNELLKLCGPKEITTFMPLMRFVPIINRSVANANRVCKERDECYYKEMKEIREQIEEDLKHGMKLTDEEEDKRDPSKTCFARSLMLRQKEENLTDLEVMLICSDLVIAGSDTTATTLEWLLLYLCAQPEIAKKAQAELDKVVGREHLVTLEEAQKLVYMPAVIREVLRLKHVGPLGVPHCTTEADELRGYHIPAKTIVLLNINAINYDPTFFPQPDKFIPERWIANDQTTKLEYVANLSGDDAAPAPNDANNHLLFGLGRRMCPGLYLASNETLITCARILQCFDIVPGNKPLRFEEDLGIVLSPVYTSEMIFKPRADVDVASLLK